MSACTNMTEVQEVPQSHGTYNPVPAFIVGFLSPIIPLSLIFVVIHRKYFFRKKP